MASKFTITAELALQTKNLNQVVNNLRQQFQGANLNIKLKDLDLAQQRMNNINKSVQSTQKSFSSLGNSIGAAAKRFGAMALATGTFVGLTRAIKNSVSEAVEFEREMIKIAQASGRTVGALKGLQNEIGQVSSSLGVSSKELVGATRNLVQAGFAANKVKEALKLLAQTELAGTFDSIADTTEGVIALLNQFGQQAQKTGTEIDFLEKSLSAISKVSKDFAVESSDLITAVRTTGSAFQSAGGDLNELIGLFTSVRATTRESAESIATGFRTIFTRVQRVDTINALKDLGIQLQDAEGKFVGPMEAAKRLSIALSTIDPKDFRFNVIVEELGGFRQVSKVIPLIQQFGTAQKALATAQKSSGELARDAATAQQGLGVQITKVREEFQAFIRELTGSAAFKETVTGALQMASAFIKIADSLKPLLPLISSFAAIKLGNAVLPALNTFMGGKRKAGGGPIGFATGGLVPGSGNGDTVPAMLTPGEFVIKKNSVKALGVEKLASMNKYADGGKLREKYLEDTKGASIQSFLSKTGFEDESKIVSAFKPSSKIDREFGAVFLRPNDINEDINGFVNSSEIANKYLSTKNIKDNSKKNFYIDAIDKAYGGKGINFKIHSSSIKKEFEQQFQESLLGDIANTVDNNASKLLQSIPDTKGIGKGATYDILKKSNLDQTLGNIFEATLKVASGRFADSDTGAGNQSFDFPTGLGNAAKAFTKPDLANIMTDAKTSFSEQSIGSLVNKVRSTLADEAIKGFISQQVTNNPEAIFGTKSVPLKAIQGNPLFQALAGDGELKAKDIEAIANKYGFNVNTRGGNYSFTKKANGGAIASLTDIPWMASGGSVGTDTVPAMLTPGEFVINKASAQRIGYGNLSRMNNVAKFATGGPVGVQHFADGGAATGGMSPQNLLILATAAGTLATQFSGLSDTTKQMINTAILSGGVVKGILNNVADSVKTFADKLPDDSRWKFIGTFEQGIKVASVTMGSLTAAANAYSEFLKADSAKLSKSIDDLVSRAKKGEKVSLTEAGKLGEARGENLRRDRAAAAATSGTSLLASTAVTTGLNALLRKSKYGKIISGAVSGAAGLATSAGFGASSYYGKEGQALPEQLKQVAIASVSAAESLNKFSLISQTLDTQSFENIQRVSVGLSSSMKVLKDKISGLEKAGAPAEEIEKLKSELDNLTEGFAKTSGELKSRTLKNIAGLVAAGKTLSTSDIEKFSQQIGGTAEEQKANSAALASATAQAYRQEAALKKEEEAREALIGSIAEERGMMLAAQKAKYGFEQNDKALRRIGGGPEAFTSIADAGALEVGSRTKELDKALSFVTSVMGKRGAELSQNFLDLQDASGMLDTALIELNRGIGSNINIDKFFEDYFQKQTGRSGGVVTKEISKFIQETLKGVDKGQGGATPGTLGSKEAIKQIREKYETYKKDLQEKLQSVIQTFAQFEDGLKANLSRITESQAKVTDLQLQSIESLQKYTSSMEKITGKDLTLRQKDAMRSMRQGVLGGAAAGSPQALLNQIRTAEQKQKTLQGGRTPSSVNEIISFNKNMHSLDQTVQNSKKALEELANQSDRTSDIMEQIDKEQAKKGAVAGLAKEFTFGTAASRDDLAKRIQALQVAMTTGNINNVPEELRQGVSQLLDQFKDVPLFNGMTGEDVSKRLQYNQLVGAGVNPQAAQSIFTQTSPEKQLIGELQRTFAQEQEARNALAQIEFGYQDELNKNIKNLTQTLYQFLYDIKNNPEKIKSQQADARASLLNQGVRGASPLTGEQLNNAAGIFQAAADNFAKAVERIAPANKANGGIIYRAGGGFQPRGTDTVPAMLTPGEYVIRKSAVDAIGVDTLNQINHMASGGYVGARRRMIQQQFAARQNMMMGQAGARQGYYTGSRRERMLARRQERENAAAQADQAYKARVASEANGGQGLMPNQRVASTVAGGTRVVTDVRGVDRKAQRIARGAGTLADFGGNEQAYKEYADRMASGYAQSTSGGQEAANQAIIKGLADEGTYSVERVRSANFMAGQNPNAIADTQAKIAESKRLRAEYEAGREKNRRDLEEHQSALRRGAYAEGDGFAGFMHGKNAKANFQQGLREARESTPYRLLNAGLSFVPGLNVFAAGVDIAASAASSNTVGEAATSTAMNIGPGAAFKGLGAAYKGTKGIMAARNAAKAIDAAGDAAKAANATKAASSGASEINKLATQYIKQNQTAAGIAYKGASPATVGSANNIAQQAMSRTRSQKQTDRLTGAISNIIKDAESRPDGYRMRELASGMISRFTGAGEATPKAGAVLDPVLRGNYAAILRRSRGIKAKEAKAANASVVSNIVLSQAGIQGLGYSQGGPVGYYAEGGGVQATIANRAARGMYDASDNIAAAQSRNQIIAQGQQNYMNQFNGMNMTHSLNVDGMLNIGGIDGEGIAGQISDGLGQYIGQIVMNMMQKHGVKNTNPNGI